MTLEDFDHALKALRAALPQLAESAPARFRVNAFGYGEFLGEIVESKLTIWLFLMTEKEGQDLVSAVSALALHLAAGKVRGAAKDFESAIKCLEAHRGDEALNVNVNVPELPKVVRQKSFSMDLADSWPNSMDKAPGSLGALFSNEWLNDKGAGAGMPKPSEGLADLISNQNLNPGFGSTPQGNSGQAGGFEQSHTPGSGQTGVGGGSRHGGVGSNLNSLGGLDGISGSRPKKVIKPPSS